MSGGYDYLLRVVTQDLADATGSCATSLNLGCVDHVETGFALQRVVDRTILPLKHPRAVRDKRGEGLNTGIGMQALEAVWICTTSSRCPEESCGAIHRALRRSDVLPIIRGVSSGSAFPPS
jgi:hypothetical protein